MRDAAEVPKREGAGAGAPPPFRYKRTARAFFHLHATSLPFLERCTQRGDRLLPPRCVRTLKVCAPLLPLAGGLAAGSVPALPACTPRPTAARVWSISPAAALLPPALAVPCGATHSPPAGTPHTLTCFSAFAIARDRQMTALRAATPRSPCHPLLTSQHPSWHTAHTLWPHMSAFGGGDR